MYAYQVNQQPNALVCRLSELQVYNIKKNIFIHFPPNLPNFFFKSRDAACDTTLGSLSQILGSSYLVKTFV